MGPFDDYKKVKCPDGSERYILKRLNNLPRIFGEYVPEWEFKINSGAKAAMELAEANVGLEIKKSAKKLYDKILEIDSTARTLFRMAYMQFTTNPCNNDGVLNEAISKIMKLVSKLSAVHKKIESLKAKPMAEEPQYRAFTTTTMFKMGGRAKTKHAVKKNGRKTPAASRAAEIDRLLSEIKGDLKAATAKLK